MIHSLDFEDLLAAVKRSDAKDYIDLYIAITEHLNSRGINESSVPYPSWQGEISKIMMVLSELDNTIKVYQVKWFAPAGFNRGTVAKLQPLIPQ